MNPEQEPFQTVAFYLEKGERGLAVFQMIFRDEKPEVAFEFLDVKGEKAIKTLSLNPALLQRLPAGNAWKADYLYQGEIVFPKLEDN
jgi:hypothetical protein